MGSHSLLQRIFPGITPRSPTLHLGGGEEERVTERGHDRAFWDAGGVLFLHLSTGYGWEDPLEREMATHSRILAWRISWTEEPGGLQSKGLQRVGHDRTHTHTHTHTAHFGSGTWSSLWPRGGSGLGVLEGSILAMRET